jgi:hypothetical protein
MTSMKRISITLCILTLSLGALALARHGQSSHGQSRPESKLKRPDIPDQVIYKHLFHHVTALKKKAEDVEKEGNDGTQFRTHFKRQADLSDAQAQTLDQIAADCDIEIKQLEVRAKLLIQVYKAQYPGGKVPHGQLPKPPPTELRTLTEQRDAVVLRGRDRLKTAFGESEFNRFSTFVKERVAPNVYLIQPQRPTSAPQDGAQ